MGPKWFAVLEAARRLSEEGFTSEDLADEAQIPDGESSTATQIASAWLGKFGRWGYALPTSEKATTNGRWSRIWKLTRWGYEYDPAFNKRKKARKGEEAK